MNDFKKIISDLRNKRKMTLAEIANSVGVDMRSIQNYEKGIEPRDKNVQKRLNELHDKGVVSTPIAQDEVDLLRKLVETQSIFINDYRTTLMDNANKNEILLKAILYTLCAHRSVKEDRKISDILKEVNEVIDGVPVSLFDSLKN